MPTKKIVFNYFTVSLVEEGKGEVFFDFEKWIHVAKGFDSRALKQTIKGVIISRDNVEYYGKGSLYVIRFMRLRQDGLPFKVKVDEEAEDMTLDPDEYLGEDTNMLYDTRNGIVMLQKNKFSVSCKYLEYYLTEIWHIGGGKGTIRFNIITKDFDIPKIKEKKFRRFDIGIANKIPTFDYDEYKHFSSALNFIKESNAINAGISLSVVRSQKSLDHDKVCDAIDFVMDNTECIRSANIAVGNDDCEVEEINLLENTYISFIGFKNVERTSIGFEFMSSQMREQYIEHDQGALVSLLLKE